MKILKRQIKKDLLLKTLIVFFIFLIIFISLALLSPERREMREEERKRSSDMQNIGSAVKLNIKENEITIDHILICSADSPKTFNDSCARMVGMPNAPTDPLGMFYRISSTEEGKMVIWSPSDDSRWGSTKEDGRIF